MSLRLIIFSLLSLVVSVVIFQNRAAITSSRLGAIIIPFVTGGRVSMAADGQIFISNSDTNSTTAISPDLPESFPANMPVFPGATVDLGLSYAEEDSVSVNFVTSYPMRRVVNYYKRWLPKKGWQVTTLQDNNSGYKILISNNKWQGNLWVNPGSRETQIAIDLYR